MAAGMLPPVIAEITLNTEQFAAGIDQVRGQMTGLVGETDSAMAAVQTGSDDGAAGLDRLAASGDAASASLGRTAESATAAGDAMVATGEKAGAAGDAAGLMGAGATRGAEDVKRAEDDAESHTSGFSGRVAGVFSKVGETMAHFGIPFHESVSKMGEDISSAETRGAGFSQSIQQIGKVATVVGATAIAGFGAESFKMADEFDVAETRLKVAIHGVGGSFQSVQPQIEGTYTRMEHLGFNSQETAETLTTLTTAAKSPTKAIQDMGLAADLARQRNISLSSAGEMLAKVYAGSNRAITQMGINLNIGSAKLHSIQSATESVHSAQVKLHQTTQEISEGTLKGAKASFALQSAHEKLSSAELKLKQDQNATKTVMAALEQRTKGAAKAFGGTLAGQVATAKAAVHNLGIQFGEILIPILSSVIGALSSVVGFFQKNEAAAIALGVIVGGPLVAAIATYAAVQTAAGVKAVASYAAMGASAVASAAVQVAGWAAVAAAAVAAFIAENMATLGIAAAIALLIAAVVFLVTHWTQAWNFIKEVAVAVWHAIEQALTTIWDAIKAAAETYWNALKAFFTLVFNVYKTIAETVWNTIKAVLVAVWGAIRSAAETVFNAIRAVIQAEWSVIQAVTQAVWSTVQSIVNGAIHAVESVVNGGLGNVVRFFTSLPGRIVSAISGLASELFKFGEHIIQELIHGVESMAGSLASSVSHVISSAVSSVPGVNLVKSVIPHLATGGIVSSPTLALVGEAGPEAVVPLSQFGGAAALGGGVSPLPSSGASGAGGGAAGGLQIGSISIVTEAKTTPQLVDELYLRLRPMLRGNPA